MFDLWVETIGTSGQISDIYNSAETNKQKSLSR